MGRLEEVIATLKVAVARQGFGAGEQDALTLVVSAVTMTRHSDPNVRTFALTVIRVFYKLMGIDSTPLIEKLKEDESRPVATNQDGHDI